MSQESSSSHSSESSLAPEPSPVADAERALIVQAIQTQAAKDLQSMTPDEVVDTVIALAMVQVLPPAPDPVAAPVPATAPATPPVVAELSPDPLIANNQVRGLIGQEIARLRELSASPAILKIEHLFSGHLFK